MDWEYFRLYVTQSCRAEQSRARELATSSCGECKATEFVAPSSQRAYCTPSLSLSRSLPLAKLKFKLNEKLMSSKMFSKLVAFIWPLNASSVAASSTCKTVEVWRCPVAAAHQIFDRASVTKISINKNLKKTVKNSLRNSSRESNYIDRSSNNNKASTQHNQLRFTLLLLLDQHPQDPSTWIGNKSQSASFISGNLCVFINKTIHNLIIQFDDEL